MWVKDKIVCCNWDMKMKIATEILLISFKLYRDSITSIELRCKYEHNMDVNTYVKDIYLFLDL